MSDDVRYTLKMTGEGFDPEFVIFKMLRDAGDARNHFDSHGKSASNGYDWRSLEEDMRGFSKTQPGILFRIVEKGNYGGESFESRHYFKNGRHTKIDPVVKVTWPAFDESMLA